jgi:hypothetical protein
VFRSAPDVTAGRDRLVETWESARTTLAPHLSAAREAVAPYVEEAGARMTPVLDEARARVAPAVESARTRLVTDVVPTVTAAVETARENSAPARAEAKERATAALLALAGKQRQVRRWPTALACLVAGAAAGVAAGTFARGRQSTPAVVPTPFPTVPATTTHSPTTGTADTATSPGPSTGS